MSGNVIDGRARFLAARAVEEQGCSVCGGVLMLTLRDGALFCGKHDPRWAVKR